MNQPAIHTTWNRLKSFFGGSHTSSGILRGLIHEEESTLGYERNDVRAKAKKWLITNGKTLATRDILLARAHFGYLLPANWGT
jgi:hypothetical protein